jgi:ATP-dependent DNA ligase
LPSCCARRPKASLNQHYVGDGDIVYRQACKLGCEGIVSKRLGSTYRSGRSRQWIKIKNPAAPAVRREAEEEPLAMSGAADGFND